MKKLAMAALRNQAQEAADKVRMLESALSEVSSFSQYIRCTASDDGVFMSAITHKKVVELMRDDIGIKLSAARQIHSDIVAKFQPQPEPEVCEGVN